MIGIVVCSQTALRRPGVYEHRLLFLYSLVNSSPFGIFYDYTLITQVDLRKMERVGPFSTLSRERSEKERDETWPREWGHVERCACVCVCVCGGGGGGGDVGSRGLGKKVRCCYVLLA